MSSDPYQSTQTHSDHGPPPEAPNPIGMILGIVSIVTGVLGFFVCCCIIVNAPLALISIGTGVGGLMTADPRQPIGKTLSIVGLVIGGLALLLSLVWLLLNTMGAIGPNDFGQFQNDF